MKKFDTIEDFVDAFNNFDDSIIHIIEKIDSDEIFDKVEGLRYISIDEIKDEKIKEELESSYEDCLVYCDPDGSLDVKINYLGKGYYPCIFDFGDWEISCTCNKKIIDAYPDIYIPITNYVSKEELLACFNNDVDINKIFITGDYQAYGI